MKFVSLLFICIFLATVCSAQQHQPVAPGKTNTAAAEAQKSAPVVSEQQKAQVKDFQLTDSQLEVQIMRLQEQQRENQARAQAYIATLCRSEGSRHYQLHFPDLTCAALPASTQK